MAWNVVDRLIGWFNPRAGLARHVDRQRLSRAYEAASPRDTWRPRRGNASANADHRADAATLRAKARALVQNVPYIAAGLDAHVAQVIGTGIVPRAAGKQAKVLADLHTAWAKECDADGLLDYYGLQAKMLRAMEQDGEVLIRLRYRRPSDGFAVPLQLQVIEIDWLDTMRNGANGANTIVNGIEYDVIGRVVQYWLWSEHPGDARLTQRLESKPVPASVVIHLFDPRRPGQNRGFSRFAPVIAGTRDLQLYFDAEIARKNLETRLGVLYSGDLSQMANPELGSDVGSPADAAAARSVGSLGELSSGSINELPGGGSVTVVEPKPAGGYVEYSKFHLHLIATACGWTYEMMTGDMSEVNFSSARVRQMDYRRQSEQLQWLVLIPRALEAINRAFVDAAFLSGKVRQADYTVLWSTPKWGYVNPKDEVAAEQSRIASGTYSISQTIRDHGEDPEEVFSQIKADMDRFEKDGTLDLLLFQQKGTERVNEDTTPQAATKPA